MNRSIAFFLALGISSLASFATGCSGAPESSATNGPTAGEPQAENIPTRTIARRNGTVAESPKGSVTVMGPGLRAELEKGVFTASWPHPGPASAAASERTERPHVDLEPCAASAIHLYDGEGNELCIEGTGSHDLREYCRQWSHLWKTHELVCTSRWSDASPSKEEDGTVAWVTTGTAAACFHANAATGPMEKVAAQRKDVAADAKIKAAHIVEIGEADGPAFCTQQDIPEVP